MATVEIQEYRVQYAHFGLYRQSVGGDERLIIRRKVGEPTDYMHLNSKAVQRQRETLAVASRHYASLTPSQKAKSRQKLVFVDYIKDHGKSDTKLLMGRQLLISQDIRELTTAGQLVKLPREICIILCNEELYPLSGYLWLYYYENEEWHEVEGEELDIGNWLFSEVPAGKEYYRVEGWASGYYDPKRPVEQYMTESYLLTHHYHILLWGHDLVIFEDWSPIVPPKPNYELVINEPWG